MKSGLTIFLKMKLPFKTEWYIFMFEDGKDKLIKSLDLKNDVLEMKTTPIFDKDKIFHAVILHNFPKQMSFKKPRWEKKYYG